MTGERPQMDGDIQQIASLSQKWRRLLWLGILLLTLGFLAIWFDTLTTFLTVGMIGLFLALGGFAILAQALSTREWKGYLLHFLLGVLYVGLGLLVFLNPVLGAMSLTMLLAALFVVTGLMRSITALRLRFENWGWFLASGLISFFLGVFIWSQWALASLFMLGLFVGIDLIFAGWGVIMLALSARKASSLHSI